MKDLITRLEKATGPDRELDALIWCAVFAPKTAYVKQSPINGAWCIYNGESYRNPGQPALWEDNNSRVQPVTSSIDAAMTLVPEKHYWTVSAGLDDNGPPRGLEGSFSAECPPVPFSITPRTWAKHPAIALCIASLKARAQQKEAE